MANENRRNKRVPIAASARLTYASAKGSQSLDSTVASISLPGVGLYSDCLVAKGTSVSLEITFIATDGLMKTDQIEGKIINANDLADLCYICIVFDEEINAQKQPFLYEHLSKLLRRD